MDAEEGKPPLRIKDASLVRIDPVSNKPVAATQIGTTLILFPALAVGDGAVWLTDRSGNTVSRVDGHTNTLTRTVAVRGSPVDVAVGPAGVWIAGINGVVGTLTLLDSASGYIRRSFALHGVDPVAVAVGADAVWIASRSPEGSAIVRVDPKSGAISATIPLPGGDLATDVAVGRDGVWATARRPAGAVSAWNVFLVQIDPAAARIVKSIPLGRTFATGGGQLALLEDDAWVITGHGVARVSLGPTEAIAENPDPRPERHLQRRSEWRRRLGGHR